MPRDDLQLRVGQFIEKWRNFDAPSSDSIVDDYFVFCRDLLFLDEDTVGQVLSILTRNMEMWALEMSPVYKKSKVFYSKEDFEDRSCCEYEDFEETPCFCMRHAHIPCLFVPLAPG